MRRAVKGFVIATLLGCASAAHADTYNLGTLDGQNGWNGGKVANVDVGFTNNNPGNEAVTNAAANTGTQSWRFSTGYGSPGPGTPFSPQLTASAGLEGSLPSRDADTFAISFWFKPVGTLADVHTNGSSQNIYEGTTDRDDRTGSNLYLTNTAGGVRLGTYSDPDGTDASTTFVQLALLDDINWHHVEMITTSSGTNPANETTSFKIDGVSAGTTIPWADPYRFTFPTPVYPSASSVKFASSNGGASSTIGFYYDDLSYSVYNSATPNTVLASYSTSFEGAAIVPTPKTVWAGMSLFVVLIGGFKRLRGQPELA